MFLHITLRRFAISLKSSNTLIQTTHAVMYTHSGIISQEKTKQFAVFAPVNIG